MPFISSVRPFLNVRATAPLSIPAARSLLASQNASPAIASSQRRSVFGLDVGLGPNSDRTSSYFWRNRLTADGNLLLDKAHWSEELVPALLEYLAVYEKKHGHPPSGEEFNPWRDLEYMDYEKLRQDGVPYSECFMEAAGKPGKEGGKTVFYFSDFSAQTFIEDIINIEKRTGKSFAEYARTVDYNTLITILRQPAITTVELHCLLLDDQYAGRVKSLEYRSRDTALLDQQKLQTLASAALDEARKISRNRKPDSAIPISWVVGSLGEAIRDLQQYIRGDNDYE